MTHDPYSVYLRKPLTAKQKMQIFLEHKGKCCVCGEKIDGVRDSWDEHVNPLWLSGDNSASNRAPAHERCARAKTSGEATQRAKGRAVAEKHFGARPKSKWGGCRGSKWRKRMDGTVERRD